MFSIIQSFLSSLTSITSYSLRADRSWDIFSLYMWYSFKRFSNLCWHVSQRHVILWNNLHEINHVQTLCNPVDCSPPGSSIHGNFQARILEWVAIPSSRGSSQPRDQTQVFCIAKGFFTIWAINYTLILKKQKQKNKRKQNKQTNKQKNKKTLPDLL